jgi:5-methylcytosine-specific restriction enzyme subunit McrC
MSTIPPLTEWRPSEPIKVTGAQRRGLETYFEATISSAPGDDMFVVTPGNIIGSLFIDGSYVVVKPKFEIDRVLFMVAYTYDPIGWRDHWAQIAGAKDLVDGMAGLFVAAADKALSRGLYRSYRKVENDQLAVKGRIRWQRQARRAAPLPIAVRYSVHDDDVLENQVLRAVLAVLRLARLSDPAVASGIARLWRQFRDFSVLMAPLSDLSRLQCNRQNEHYRPLLGLARLILENAMADLGAGDVATRGFTLTVYKVFEQFVRTALREQWGCSLTEFPDKASAHGLRMDQAGLVGLKPDLGVRVNQKWVFVGDVKYKRDEGKGEANDLYQLLAYATATHLPQATLIYADGPRGLPHHLVKNTDVQLRMIRLDLTSTPDQLLAQLAAVDLIPARSPEQRFAEN